MYNVSCFGRLKYGNNIFPPFSPLKAAYGPGQPPSLVFATPPPPQMNSAPQPRQVLSTACCFFQHSLSKYVICFALYKNLPFLLFHEDFWHGFFCYKALAKSVYVCECYSLLSPWMSILTSSFLSSAVLPVCCRAPYFTPTGTNTPHFSLHPLCLLSVMHAFSSTCWRIRLKGCSVY